MSYHSLPDNFAHSFKNKTFFGQEETSSFLAFQLQCKLVRYKKQMKKNPEATPSTLTFFGAAGTVTGSKYLIQSKGIQILLDCGLFQGFKELRLRNWKRPPFDPAQINAVVLSHAHLDHSGYLPSLVKQHFRGKIHTTAATKNLLRVLLLDAAHLQEEEARFANKWGYSKHKPALSFYTVKDVQTTLKQIKHSPYNKPVTVTHGIKALFRRAGHILGSATLELHIGDQNPRKLVFSGDLGRWDQPILRDPELVPEADILLLESTYGDRLHSQKPIEELAAVIQKTAEKKGVLIIPAFAVGRTQEVIWMIRDLEDQGKIPVLPVYLDSPMATDVTDIYCAHPEEHDADMQKLRDKESCPLHSQNFSFVRSRKDSQRLNQLNGPMIIIASSGMMTGGRVLHHLKQRLDKPTTTVILVGYQAPGTRGRLLQDGAKQIKMLGKTIPVKATIETIGGLSAHADKEEIFRWLAGFKKPPQKTYLVHGEPKASASLAEEIKSQLGWNVEVAQDGQTINL